MWLIVGLGNPGADYADTRHNVGFMVADALCARGESTPARIKFGAELREVRLGSERVLLCKPMEFMNLSGGAVSRVSGFWKVAPDQIVVVYDDLDLPFGRLRLGKGGGAGGHNGMRSVIEAVGSEFARVRVGIGRPPGGQDARTAVLGGFSKVERQELPLVLAEAADAVETILGQGLIAAMNRFNAKKKETSNSDKGA